MTEQRRSHWERVYGSKSPMEVSWYQQRPLLSLDLIQSCRLDPSAGIIDVGGGTSSLVDELMAKGHSNLAVLDVSRGAIEQARHRLGTQADLVEWYEADVTEFDPPRQYGLWHDRAVFHFLTESSDRLRYRESLLKTVQPDGHVIAATFAVDGPKRCSGLDVVRYSPDTLSSEFGEEFELVESRDELHHTPGGGEQKFVYCRFRRVA